MDPAQFSDVWGAAEVEHLTRLVDVVAPPTRHVCDQPQASLEGVEVLITGWGASVLDTQALDALPQLSIVAHAAGSVRMLAVPEFWDLGIPVISAVDQNTVPTAEFAAAEIIYALKKGWQSSIRLRQKRAWRPSELPIPGLDGSVVGLVSLGRVGRHVAQRLAAIGSLRVIAFDPHLTTESAHVLGVEPVSLDELFTLADVVSLHTPWIPQTTGLVNEGLLRSLKPGATLINTARGAIIDQDALVRVLRDRPDLFAALDVTHPEPLPIDSPLWNLENVSLTPHIAGSAGNEKAALARSILAQLERFLTGQSIHPVAHDDLRSTSATRRVAAV